MISPMLALRMGLTTLLLALVFFGGRSCGKQAGDAEVKTLKQHQAETLTDIANAATKASELAREAEHTTRAAFAAIDAQYLRDHDDAQATAARVTADLHDGNVRLRHDLATAACPVPGAAATASGSDAAAERGNEIAGAAIGVAAEADAQLAACQAVIRADRGLK